MMVAGVFYPLSKNFKGVTVCKPGAVTKSAARMRRSAAGSTSRQHMFKV